MHASQWLPHDSFLSCKVYGACNTAVPWAKRTHPPTFKGLAVEVRSRSSVTRSSRSGRSNHPHRDGDVRVQTCMIAYRTCGGAHGGVYGMGTTDRTNGMFVASQSAK